MNTRNIFRRILLTTGIVIALLLLSAILIPVFFKDKIFNLAKTQLNKQLNATADFKDIDISLFRHFPNLAVGIKNISIVNKAPFAGDTLISAENIDISLDLMKALNSNYDITGVEVNNPRIHALVNEQGEANWNITKPDTSKPATANGPEKPFNLKLRKYSINNGYILYKDDQAHMQAELVNLNHSGTGDFTSDNFTLSTKTTTDATSFAYGNISYLTKVKTLLDLDLQVDNKAHKYTFSNTALQLNGLKINTSGFVQMPDTSNILMDITFKTPSNDFKDILSLVPSIYQNNFKDIQTSGKAAFDGFVKGTYNARQMPAYNVNLLVENGSFKYPDLPQGVNDIQIKMNAACPDGVTDHAVVNIEKGHIAFGGEPFDFHLLLKTPISSPWVDAGAKGKIDLSQMQRFMKLAAGTKLSGIINADVTFRGAISAAQKQQYESIYAGGTIGISNMFYASSDYPDGVRINSLLLTFNPKNVTATNLSGNYLASNFTGSGTIDNLLGYYLHNDPLSATVTIAADKVDVNKWIGPSGNSKAAPAQNTAATPAAAGTAFVVPSNLNVLLNVQAGQVLYDKLVLTNLKGALAVKDQTIFLQHITSNGLDGILQLDGYYSTRLDKKNPDIQIAYKLQGLDIAKTFAAFNTMDKLMPIARYLSGKMTSELTIKGKLGADMSPVLSSLSGDGNLLLLNGALSKFAPIDALASKLNVSQLQNISLKDVKTWFTFANGRVSVQPFKLNVANIGMEIAGSHGFDQTMDYALNMAIPRALIGSQGNALVNNLVGQANAKGVPVKVGDVVNLAVKMGGTITKPVLQTNLKDVAGNAVNDMKNQLEAAAKSKIDSAKHVVKDTLNSIKKQAVNDAKNELVKQLSGNKNDSSNKGVNNTSNDAINKAKGALNNLFNKKK
ncbi:hypothetical protein ACTHGU_00270 [Chitinophagaceae bacterium MMS25-I14]